MQTKLQSLVETTVSTSSGYVISIASYTYVFNIDVSTTLVMTAYFTVASIIRQYVLRRYFN
jgi:hypothetical protein